MDRPVVPLNQDAGSGIAIKSGLQGLFQPSLVPGIWADTWKDLCTQLRLSLLATKNPALDLSPALESLPFTSTSPVVCATLQQKAFPSLDLIGRRKTLHSTTTRVPSSPRIPRNF